MNDAQQAATVGILAFRETTISAVFGMYDLFKSAGRDWPLIVDGHPGPQLMHPVVVSARPGPFVTANGIRIEPDAQLAECRSLGTICIPELMVAPGEPLSG